MKNAINLLLFSSLIIYLISCKKDKEENIDFYRTEYRIGLWISADKRDTLEFMDDSNLIRKGYYYGHEQYVYKIEGKNLIIQVPDLSYETQHPIVEVKGNRVVLGNMYPTTGFNDNSGTFFKEIEP